MKIGKLRISAVRNKSFEERKYAIANVGESIQSVAMELIYKKCGIKNSDIIKINQCDVRKYRGERIILPLRLPLSRENVDEYLPLNESVHPFFISLHLHDDIFENRPDLVEYFKKYQPIGCRDEISCDFFRIHGIDSYIMGCYTLAFSQRDKSDSQNKIVLVDVSKALYEKIPEELKSDAVRKTHAVPYMEYPVTPQEDDRLESVARDYVDFYRNQAKIVITSRLHAAAPCLAMGIPVVLASDNADFRYAWIDKFLPIFQSGEYEKIKYNPKPADVSIVRDNLFELFDGIVNHGTMHIDALKNLDMFYRSRRKTEYYKLFRERLLKLRDQFGDGEFSYAIWGAGNHSVFAHELMQEMYPKARLAAVVDKFKTGTKFGVPIIRGNELAEYNVEHVCISTKPGMPEAIIECKRIYGEECEQYYTIITSQQES